MSKVLWKFRYKAPYGGVADGVIETNGPDEKVALEVAQHFLDTHKQHPRTALIPGSLTPLAEHSEDAMRAIQKKAAEPVEETGPDASAAAGRGGSQIGAVDDPASQRPKAGRVGA